MNNKGPSHTLKGHTFFFISFTKKFIIQITWNSILYHCHASPAIFIVISLFRRFLKYFPYPRPFPIPTSFSRTHTLFPYPRPFPVPTPFSFSFWFAPDGWRENNVSLKEPLHLMNPFKEYLIISWFALFKLLKC